MRYLSTEERAALLEQTAKDRTLHTFVILALSTACRAGELLKLAWRDVDFEEGRLLFRQTKSDEPRQAWLSGELYACWVSTRRDDRSTVMRSSSKRHRQSLRLQRAVQRSGQSGQVEELPLSRPAALRSNVSGARGSYGNAGSPRFPHHGSRCPPGRGGRGLLVVRGEQRRGHLDARRCQLVSCEPWQRFCNGRCDPRGRRFLAFSP